MNYLIYANISIRLKLLSLVRTNEVQGLEECYDYVVEHLLRINHIGQVWSETSAVASDSSGLVLTASELGEYDFPIFMKPLLLPRSVRFSLDNTPKHPDLKDYDAIGGMVDRIDIHVARLADKIDKMKAILGRNKISTDTFKVKEVWKDQTLADVMSNISLVQDTGKGAECLHSITEAKINSVPVPIIKEVFNVISDFNMIGDESQWASVFAQTFHIPTMNK